MDHSESVNEHDAQAAQASDVQGRRHKDAQSGGKIDTEVRKRFTLCWREK